MAQLSDHRPTDRSRRSSVARPFVISALVMLFQLMTLATGPAASATTPGANGRIAFKGYLDADRSTGALFTMTPSGKHVRQVTSPASGTVDDQPDWAPDGSLIAFRRCAPDTVCAIYTIRPDGTGLRRLTAECSAPPADLGRCSEETEVAFLPDGKRVAYTRSTGSVREFPNGEGFIEHSDIVIRDLTSGRTNVVLRGERFGGDNNEVVVSPSGKQIAFHRVNSPLARPAGGIAVFVMSIDGRHVQRVTPWSLKAGDHPDWSPDGCWILFRSNDAGSFLNSQLYVIHPGGSGMRQVTHVSPETMLLSASFSPDGDRIVYSQSGDSGQPDIFTARVKDGKDVRQLTHTPLWESAPDWGPRR